MLKSALAQAATRLPEPAHGARARRAREDWCASVANLDDRPTRELAAALLADSETLELLDFVFAGSPHLSAIIEREPAFMIHLLAAGPVPLRERVMADVRSATDAAPAGNDPSAALRIAKRRIALLTAIADITGFWSLEQVTGTLSDFAAGALGAACAYLLGIAARNGAFTLPDPADPQRDSGLIVLAMGKLGAGELNYSSDIDLIVFYDPEKIVTRDADALQHHFVRLTRGLVRIMAERTADGYVFRTDLRLRPDPGSTPPAMSVLAAETYYETLGQNWERAALIKARPIAGDIAAGRAFLDRLRPYIWRKNLDFAAIQDIHSIKRQINAHRGGGAIAVLGHNIKLGRGGIREIEFFAQTQQLIWGGRLPKLRANATIAALDALAETGKIGGDVARELTAAYRFLRSVEHRLQMINDEQTHTLPDDVAGLTELAVFLGYRDAASFETDLLGHLRRVESHYAKLFEDAPTLSMDDAGGGNLVFTGGEPDPETLQTLERLGFTQTTMVDGAVRGWHHGRCRAMRSTRARELLTELMPILLKSLADAPDPDGAFLAFDKFLSGLPAGIQLFSMFHAYPDLLRLVAEICGSAPRLAELLGRRPSLLESVLTADFFARPPGVEELRGELGAMLSQARDREDVLDLSRRWANDRRFQVGVQSLRGLLDTDEAAIAWSNIAEAALGGLYPLIEAEFADQHGRIAGCGMAIVAMGKLGGREMTATSDLDLIFVYATPDDDALSDGKRPLAASQYFARLSQRLINGLTAPTAEGQLFEVDMRLRPSGKAGPIAVSLASFERYQREQAWTWEQMALTRARVVAGPPALTGAIEAIIHDVLTRERDPHALVADIADMRQRLANEHGTPSRWDVKHMPGGIVDIEFIAQYLQLRHAHAVPAILSQNTLTVLQRARTAGLLDETSAGELISALKLWQAVQARLRLCLPGQAIGHDSEERSAVLRQVLGGLNGLEYDALVHTIEQQAHATRRHFLRLIGLPATTLPKGERVDQGINDQNNKDPAP
jgi:glutamate-ammonia-ligase adenylyltransferase